MKKISLIIPVYNTEKYLEKCLESACNQTYQNMEIVCVDDGSTDASGRIVDVFAAKDSRVVAIHQKNHGESDARNRGLQIASGEYIGFMDCDDWIEPDMYESLVTELEKENADIAISGWFKDTGTESVPIRNEKKIDEEVFARDKLLKYLYERDSYREFAYMWDKLYKREVLFDENRELILFDTQLRLGGDVLYLGKVALNVEKAVYINKPFYHYLQRQDSGCHSKDISKRTDWLNAYIKLIAIYESNGIEKYVVDLLKRFLVYHSANVAQIAYEQRNDEMLRCCKEIIEKYRKEYELLNQDKPERIVWLNEILAYHL